MYKRRVKPQKVSWWMIYVATIGSIYLELFIRTWNACDTPLHFEQAYEHAMLTASASISSFRLPTEKQP
jgi:hypothetical protein